MKVDFAIKPVDCNIACPMFVENFWGIQMLDEVLLQ